VLRVEAGDPAWGAELTESCSFPKQKSWISSPTPRAATSARKLSPACIPEATPTEFCASYSLRIRRNRYRLNRYIHGWRRPGSRADYKRRKLSKIRQLVAGSCLRKKCLINSNGILDGSIVTTAQCLGRQVCCGSFIDFRRTFDFVHSVRLVGKLSRWYTEFMATQRQSKFIAPEEYLEIQRTSDVRSEYIYGEIFEMSAASRQHGEIVVNIAVELGSVLRGKSCRAGAAIAVRAPAFLSRFPTLSSICDGGDFTDLDEVLNDPCGHF